MTSPPRSSCSPNAARASSTPASSRRRSVDHVARTAAASRSKTSRDYRVIRRRPVRAEFCGQEFLSNPPPSAGGILIAYGLPLLEDRGAGVPGTAQAIDALARVMREQAEARVGGFDRALRRGGLARALEERAAVVSRGTTHISVIDGNGDAVALTASTGAGSGVVVPGTGIHLNNMIGEFDLAKPPRAGERLSSMMSPSAGAAGWEPAPRRRQRRLAAAARRRDADRRQRRRARPAGRGCDRASARAPRGRRPALRGRTRSGRARQARGDGLERDALAPPQPLLRRRGGGDARGRELAAAGDPRRGGAGVVVE